MQNLLPGALTEIGKRARYAQRGDAPFNAAVQLFWNAETDQAVCRIRR